MCVILSVCAWGHLCKEIGTSGWWHKKKLGHVKRFPLKCRFVGRSRVKASRFPWTCSYSFDYGDGSIASPPPVGLNTQLRGGGAGGASATQRKRKEHKAQIDVLMNLGKILQSFVSSNSVAAAKPKKKKKKKRTPVAVAPEVALVDELSKLVADLKNQPHLYTCVEA